MLLINILFLAGSGKGYLDLEGEYKQITKKLLASTNSSQFNIKRITEVTVEKITNLLFSYHPQIFHFAGHGNEKGFLIGDEKVNTILQSNALVDLFSIINKDQNIRCVFLNAAYSATSCKDMIQHVDCVVGILENITDEAAVKFAIEFYQALGHGKSVKDAFELSRIVAQISDPDVASQLKLMCRDNVDPSSIVLANLTGSKTLSAEIKIKQEKNDLDVEKTKILFLSANPRDTEPIRVDEERKKIKTKLRQSEFRDRFDLQMEFAITYGDLQNSLLKYKPQIIHFSGHGSDLGALMFEDDYGNCHEIPPESLADLFKILKEQFQIDCVLLNACYSEDQARRIAEYVPFVIGTNNSISDAAAIGFASSFYMSLGEGQTVRTAFDIARNFLKAYFPSESDVPKLLPPSTE